MSDPSISSRLSEDLQRILDQTHRKDISFNQILRTTRERGFSFIMVLLSLPFVFPIPLPGLSVPIGFALFLF